MTTKFFVILAIIMGVILALSQTELGQAFAYLMAFLLAGTVGIAAHLTSAIAGTAGIALSVEQALAGYAVIYCLFVLAMAIKGLRAMRGPDVVAGQSLFTTAVTLTVLPAFTFLALGASGLHI